MPTSHKEPPRVRPWLPDILPVEPDQPLRWLWLGLRDLAKNPMLSMAHGLAVALGGWAITWLAHDRFWLLTGMVSGFFVIAPVLATSLYAMSRAIELGEPVNLHLLYNTWLQWNRNLQGQPESYWSLVRFGVLLGLAAVGWVVTSSAFIQLMALVPIQTPMDFMRHIVASREHHIFEIWLALAGLMAAPLFASSVVTMPMLLDRRVPVLTAVLTSWKAVLTYPVTLALWAFLLMVLMALGFFSLFLGLIVLVPVLGHASWHAYRDLVSMAHLPPRMDQERPL